MENICEVCCDKKKTRSLRPGIEVALCYAVQQGHDKCVSELIKEGANVNLSSGLCAAAKAGKYEYVKQLIETGADVNFVNTEGLAPLAHAANSGSTEIVKILIEAGADVNFSNDEGITAMTMAAFYGHRDILELLLKAGADVNTTTEYGDTPLCVAAYRHELDCARLLLQSNAKINMNQNCLTASIVAPKTGKGEEMNMLLFAGGEKLGGKTVMRAYPLHAEGKTPDYLLFDNLKFSLQHSCRETIRKHLLDLDPHSHLFRRIPQLGLPSSLANYLLCNVCLDRNDTN